MGPNVNHLRTIGELNITNELRRVDELKTHAINGLHHEHSGVLVLVLHRNGGSYIRSHLGHLSRINTQTS